jgi:hypothetical protein
MTTDTNTGTLQPPEKRTSRWWHGKFLLIKPPRLGQQPACLRQQNYFVPSDFSFTLQIYSPPFFTVCSMCCHSGGPRCKISPPPHPSRQQKNKGKGKHRPLSISASLDVATLDLLYGQARHDSTSITLEYKYTEINSWIITCVFSLEALHIDYRVYTVISYQAII